MKTDHAGLCALRDRGRRVDAPTNDIRGRTVKDSHGEAVGTVADLIVDDQESKVRFLLVEHDGSLGPGGKTMLPVGAVTRILKDEVFVDQPCDRIASAPGYDPDLVDDRPYQEDLYGRYGCTPHWEQGYAYPFMGLGMSACGSQA